MVDGSDLPKQGWRSVGVAHPHCGKLGKVANGQAGVFLAYSGPLERAPVWPLERERTKPECQARGARPQPQDGWRAAVHHGRAQRWVSGGDTESIPVALGSQGPRSYLSSAQRVPTRRRRTPGGIHWAGHFC